MLKENEIDLKAKYLEIGKNLINEAKNYFFDSKIISKKIISKNNQVIHSIKLNENFKLVFQEWGENPFYLNLYFKNKYIFEL